VRCNDDAESCIRETAINFTLQLQQQLLLLLLLQLLQLLQLLTCRHSNVRCDDDAASCIREAPIKFTQQQQQQLLLLLLLQLTNCSLVGTATCGATTTRQVVYAKRRSTLHYNYNNNNNNNNYYYYYHYYNCYNWINCRHSNVRCDDDAASCIREAAIKFADQNEDGPLDLILLTGRTALARSSNTLTSVMNISKPDDIRDACKRDPYLYVC